jgi:hypothetical protein
VTRDKSELTLVRISEGNDRTLAHLELLQEQGGRALRRSRSLPLSVIKRAPAVFQPRLLNENVLGSEKAIRDLVEAITQFDTPTPLDRILVMDVGGTVFIVDGHHRFDAYHTAQWKQQVACTRFR